jgi:pyruvate formate lyase activating enzyme
MNIFARGWSNGFDGPGRRFVYYLKGCNFRCLWCGNPESIDSGPEMLYYPEKSSYAAECCPYGAVGSTELDRKKCRVCETSPCINRWHDRAFERVGSEVSTAEIVAEVEQRRTLFGSDGGVTFSGGEPTLQMDALLEVAKALKERDIHLVIENNASSPRFGELGGIFDLVICDLKCVTPETHRLMTGADNGPVLRNLANAMAKTIRIPLIQELNFTVDEREAMYQFLSQARPDSVELIRLHQLGLPKYRALGRDCPASTMHPPERVDIEAFAQRLREGGVMTQLLN